MVREKDYRVGDVAGDELAGDGLLLLVRIVGVGEEEKQREWKGAEKRSGGRE
ncbi:hypothetical protein Dimus_017924, partial [Dionaea muscipula]